MTVLFLCVVFVDVMFVTVMSFMRRGFVSSMEDWVVNSVFHWGFYMGMRMYADMLMMRMEYDWRVMTLNSQAAVTEKVGHTLYQRVSKQRRRN